MIIFSELSCANITASSCAFGASLAITVVNVTVTVASDVLPTVSLIRYVKVSVPVWFKVGVYSIEVPFTTTAVPVPEEIISSESDEAAPFDPKLSLSNTSIVTAYNKNDRLLQNLYLVCKQLHHLMEWLCL